MDKPWGLEKRSAEYWEFAYWQSIKRYPEFNAQIKSYQDKVNELWQTIRKLEGKLNTWLKVCAVFGKSTSDKEWLDFSTLQMMVIELEAHVETVRAHYISIREWNNIYCDKIKELEKELKMKEQTAEVLPFRLGTSSEPPMDKDWLSKLDSGTRFLARLKASNSFVLEDFVVASDPKMMDYVFLGINLNTKECMFRWVDPQRFSQAYEFCMTLEVIETKDGNTNQVQAGRVASDAEPEVIAGVHEEK